MPSMNKLIFAHYNTRRGGKAAGDASDQSPKNKLEHTKKGNNKKKCANLQTITANGKSGTSTLVTLASPQTSSKITTNRLHEAVGAHNARPPPPPLSHGQTDRDAATRVEHATQERQAGRGLLLANQPNTKRHPRAAIQATPPDPRKRHTHTPRCRQPKVPIISQGASPLSSPASPERKKTPLRPLGSDDTVSCPTAAILGRHNVPQDTAAPCPARHSPPNAPT